MFIFQIDNIDSKVLKLSFLFKNRQFVRVPYIFGWAVTSRIFGWVFCISEKSSKHTLKFSLLVWAFLLFQSLDLLVPHFYTEFRWSYHSCSSHPVWWISDDLDFILEQSRSRKKSVPLFTVPISMPRPPVHFSHLFLCTRASCIDSRNLTNSCDNILPKPKSHTSNQRRTFNIVIYCFVFVYFVLCNELCDNFCVNKRVEDWLPHSFPYPAIHRFSSKKSLF